MIITKSSQLRQKLRLVFLFTRATWVKCLNSQHFFSYSHEYDKLSSTFLS